MGARAVSAPAPCWERSITSGGPRRFPNGPPAAVPRPMGASYVLQRNPGVPHQAVSAELVAESRALKADRQAAILAHNYQRPENPGVAGRGRDLPPQAPGGARAGGPGPAMLRR